MKSVATNQCYHIGIFVRDAKCRFMGLGEYEYNLAQQLCKRAPELKQRYGITLHFIVDKTDVGAYGDNVEYILFNKRRRFLFNNRLLRPLTAHFLPHLDLVHLTHQGTKIRRPIGAETLVTVHDVNFFHNHLKNVAHKVRRFRRGIAPATHLSFISEFTKHDVLSRFKISIPNKVILNGVNDLSQSPDESNLELPDAYFFHISRLAAKKNVHLLIQMMKYLPEENLVIAGSGHKDYLRELETIIRSENLHNVFMLGNVSTEDKAFLYRHCKALMFPSLSEGFGLPVVEAFCFGKPAFITNLTALPEVGGDAAYYFDELQPAAMAKTVENGLMDFQSNEKARSAAFTQQAEKFSWDTAAENYIRYYLEILNITPQENTPC